MAVWVAGSPTRSTVPSGTLSGMAASSASFGSSEPDALLHAVETGQTEGHHGGRHGGAAAATGPRPGAGCGANVHHSPWEIVVLFDSDTVD